MPRIPSRLWEGPLTRAYAAEERRAAREGLLPSLPLAAAALVLGLLGGLDPLTLAMCVVLVGLNAWFLAYESLIWRRFGAGSL
jgi:hypothetical protein